MLATRWEQLWNLIDKIQQQATKSEIKESIVKQGYSGYTYIQSINNRWSKPMWRKSTKQYSFQQLFPNIHNNILQKKGPVSPLKQIFPLLTGYAMQRNAYYNHRNQRRWYYTRKEKE